MHATSVHHSHHAGFTLNPVKWLVRALATRGQRVRLSQLDDHLLRDIGVDRSVAQAESSRMFWDHP